MKNDDKPITSQNTNNVIQSLAKKIPIFAPTSSIHKGDIAVACFADSRQVKTKSPLKVVEYMAYGKAIVASDIGEIPFMVGDAAILTRAGDPKSLAEGIKQLSGKKIRQKYEKKALQRAKLFQWSSLAKKLEKIYDVHYNSSS